MTSKNHPQQIIMDYYDSLIRQVDIYTEEELEKYIDENESLVNKYPDNNNDDDSSSDEEKGNYIDNKGYNEDSYLKLFDSSDESIINAFENDLYVDEDPYLKHRKYKYPLPRLSSPTDDDDDDDKFPGEKKAKYEPLPKSSKVCQFLNNMRDKMISEIQNCQKEAFKNYTRIKSELKADKSASDEEIDRTVATRLFKNKFMFLVKNRKLNSKKKWSPFNLYLFVVDFYLNKHERKLLK